jgi:hypothetical protein
MVTSNVIAIATTLFIFNRVKKSTTGCSNIAIMIAKIIGMMIDWAMYNIPTNTKRPARKMVAFA